MIKRQIRKLLLEDSLSGRLTRTLCGHKKPDVLANRCIFLACFPKSGSTYMARLLEEATHRIGLKAAYEMGHNEQNIDEEALRRCVRKLSVVQQHTQGGENNVALLAKYRMQPIVLTRNLPDIVVSLLDHMHLHQHTRNPMAFAPGQFFEWPQDEQLRWITWAYMPWYFSFYQSWKTNGDKVNAQWVEFDDLTTRPVETVTQLLARMNLPCDAAALERASNPHTSGKNSRINKGLAGRGAQLPAEVKDHLRHLAEVWKLTTEDCHRLGLETSSNS
ncbi:sulfotransferase domain-containing protein [Prosthecobacter sp.]|uniref:sulfotransferase domain-containing protein n=1 Tax=Prosthecobacter sp. TaxID=1965333 RepID=UPI001E1AE76C|nr:sulfotransferase domain-containing protein [Prosthecobacter sp.]MCB1275294.1 hypothetical protein [Prosthecobacter sp.]